jgi:predicted HTH domain antitoxin
VDILDPKADKLLKDLADMNLIAIKQTDSDAFAQVIERLRSKARGFSEGELKLEIAVWLFEKERLSLRKAADLAGMHWLDFMKVLDSRGIALHYDESLL